MAGRMFKKKHPRKPSDNQKSRPRISLPTLISCSKNINEATRLGPAHDYAEIGSLLEERNSQDRHPRFATLPRTNSTSSESYTRLFPATPSPAVSVPTTPRPTDVQSATGRRRPPPPPVPSSLRDRHLSRTRSRGRSASRHSYEAPEEWTSSLYQPLHVLTGSQSDLYEDTSRRRLRSQTSAPLLQRRVSMDLDDVWTTYMSINPKSMEKDEEFEIPQPLYSKPSSPPPMLPPRQPLSLAATPPPLPPLHPQIPPSRSSPPPHPPSLTTPSPPLTSSRPPIPPSLTTPLPLPPSLTTPPLLSSPTQQLPIAIKSPSRHQELQVSCSMPLNTTNQRPNRVPSPMPSSGVSSTQSASSTSSKSSAKVTRNQSTRSMNKPELPTKPSNLPLLSKPKQSSDSSVKPPIKRTPSKPSLLPRPAILKSRLSSPPQQNQSASKASFQQKTTDTKNPP